MPERISWALMTKRSNSSSVLNGASGEVTTIPRLFLRKIFCMVCAGGLLELSLFQKAEVCCGVEDDVIEEMDAENLAGLFELAGDFNVGGGRVERPLGVV